MNTLTDVGVASVTDVGPRLESHSGLSFATASKTLSEFDDASCVRVSRLAVDGADPLCDAAATHPSMDAAANSIRNNAWRAFTEWVSERRCDVPTADAPETTVAAEAADPATVRSDRRAA